jgi:ferredoxin-NADP reductase/predicted pyridoxine 5'-phosphate oxidase superfamily flavin-nucleotide-binding protein
MGRAFSDITFTPAVRAMQERMGSRAQYESFDHASNRADRLGSMEAGFIGQADHFYQATVSETGWPYVQHRGGPAGFLKVLDPKTIAFADFRGNVQYLSVGNLQTDDRIALIIMDYANQMRLKLIGHVRLVEASEDPALIERLRTPLYAARIERAFVITVEGYDWNCPQHITPRFTEGEIDTMTAPLHAQLRQLREQLAGSTPASTKPVDKLGHGPLALVVSAVRQLTPRVRAYELRSADGGPLPPVTAGAHLDVPVILADGSSATRSYSIASDPALPGAYEIAVLNEEEGRGGSAGVHQQFRLGLRLHCAMPRNDFALPAEGPVVLIAGGIGITPIKAMAHTLLAEGRDFVLHYAVRSRRQAPFLEQLERELGPRLSLYAADEGRRLPLDAVMAGAQTVVACGPARMLDAATQAATRLGVRLLIERFAVDRALARANKPVIVTLKRSRKVLQVPADVSILDAVEAAGIDAPASCRVGNCGTCAVKVLAGTPEHRDHVLSAQERGEKMCICVSRASSDALELDL